MQRLRGDRFSDPMVLDILCHSRVQAVGGQGLWLPPLKYPSVLTVSDHGSIHGVLLLPLFP